MDKELLNSVDDLIRHKNAAYMERNLCAVTIARLAQFFSCKVGIATHSDEELKDMGWDEAWRTILVIQLPDGQVTWHLHAAEAYIVRDLPRINNYVWDGHTTQEKYARLLKWTESLANNTNKQC